MLPVATISSLQRCSYVIYFQLTSSVDDVMFSVDKWCPPYQCCYYSSITAVSCNTLAVWYRSHPLLDNGGTKSRLVLHARGTGNRVCIMVGMVLDSTNFLLSIRMKKFSKSVYLPKSWIKLLTPFYAAFIHSSKCKALAWCLSV